MILGLALPVQAQRSLCVRVPHGISSLATHPTACPGHGRQQRHTDKDRLHLQLGGGANYTYGLLGESAATYEPDYLSWQGNGFIGIRLRPGKRRGSNVVGVWGTMGYLTDPALQRLLITQGYSSAPGPGSVNEFGEWEVGVLFHEWFRVSAGRGFQRLTDQNSFDQELSYYSLSTGFSLNLGHNIKWNTTATWLFGEDFSEYAFRPSTGLAIRFNFL
ncbi:MAG: hypothetical protein OHK0039_41590 [Bacteroidia bacterium]